ncbi:vicilin-like seed storage protein At2g18540 [Agrilus planipennis]|uniref:Vicilin-like seed storage protein At2g18540 n=1 Tax=Agrilus planipennis TaxID=224129 RepID=A0A7F5RN76_AGRPL|nr:vicilin-like seed storage protein At2g18540 [Agrilus planipennis]
MQRFLMLRKEQEEIRQQYIKDKRKELYVMHGPPKELNSALILSEVIYEREKQKEMKDFLEQHRIEEEAKYAAKVKQGAIDEAREKQEEKEKEKLKKLETRRIYLKQIEENKKAAESEKQERIKQELNDILAAGREAVQMKKNEIEEELQKRNDIKKEFDDFYKRQKQYKIQTEKEEIEQTQVIELFANAKCRIEETRKRTEQELLAEKRRRAEKIAEKVAAVAASKQEEEERILREANEEKERLHIHA